MRRDNLAYAKETFNFDESRNYRFRAALRIARRGTEAIRLINSDDTSEIKAFLEASEPLRGAKTRHTHIVMMQLVLRVGVLALKFGNIEEAKRYSRTLRRSLAGFLERRSEWHSRNHVPLYHLIQDFQKDVALQAKKTALYKSEHLTSDRREENSPFDTMEKSSKYIDPRLTDAWNQVLEAEGVKEELRLELIGKLRLQIARETRPKWADRLDHRALRTLTAPQFLKMVHADDIGADGSVSTEVIRAIDPELMKAVEMYMGQRRRRNAGPGDAEGLKIVMQRPRVAKPPTADL